MNNTSITPGDWRMFKDCKTGPNGKVWSDLFIIESNTRKLMAVLEVPRLNTNPGWRAANPDAIEEHTETLREVEANAKAIAALPKLIAALQDMRAALTEYNLLDAKKRFSLCVAAAAAGTALHEAGISLH